MSNIEIYVDGEMAKSIERGVDEMLENLLSEDVGENNLIHKNSNIKGSFIKDLIPKGLIINGVSIKDLIPEYLIV